MLGGILSFFLLFQANDITTQCILQSLYVHGKSYDINWSIQFGKTTKVTWKAKRCIRLRHVRQYCGRWRNLQYTPFISIGGLSAHGTLASGLITIKQEMWSQVVTPPLPHCTLAACSQRTNTSCWAQKYPIIELYHFSVGFQTCICFSNMHLIKERKYKQSKNHIQVDF